MIKNNFIINSYYELIPDYKISPFNTSFINQNKNLKYDNSIDSYFNKRFEHENYRYTINGRQALNIALSNYNLKPDDIVTIITTSNNFYISSCVTNEIELFCKWSRSIENNTKLILVNHEFGYSYTNLLDLKKYNIPIIEDCAFSFFNKGLNDNVGKIGDFCIYSFPKMFPIQIGGLIRSNNNILTREFINKETSNYIKKVLSFHIKNKDKIINTRICNYDLLSKLLEPLKIKPRFQLSEGDVPGVYLFKCETQINLPNLKHFMKTNGVQSSVFYGENSFFIPLHQNLNTADLEYFFELINYFIQNQNDRYNN